MKHLLVVDLNGGAAGAYATELRAEGLAVRMASSEAQALRLLDEHPVDVMLIELAREDLSALTLLEALHRREPAVPVVVMSHTGAGRDTVTTLCLGAAPPHDHTGLAIVRSDANGAAAASPSSGDDRPDVMHAAARWARGLMPIVEASRDPRTISGWSRVAYASPGALRNWCHTAGVSPRRSLVFGRLLRVAHLSHRGHRPENLLDVVDRRTLAGLLRYAGFAMPDQFPGDVETFLQRQVIIVDADMLREVRRALSARSRRVDTTVGDADATPLSRLGTAC